MREKLFAHVRYPVLCARIEDVVAGKIFPEIGFSSSVLDSLNKEEVRGIADRLHEAGLENTVHGPFRDLSPGSPDAKIRDLTQERFYQTLEVAKILEPQCVVFHTGYDPWRFHGRDHLWVKNSVATWKPVVERAEDMDVVVAIENEWEKNPDVILSLIENINSPRFRHCLDVGHFHAFAESSVDSWIKAMSPYIVELHLHDNKGDGDDHLPPGKGNFDFARFAHLMHQMIKDQPIYAIEPFKLDDIEAHIIGFSRFFLNSRQ